MNPTRWDGPDPSWGAIDRDIYEHVEQTMADADGSRRHVECLNLQHRRNLGQVVLGLEQDPRVGQVRELLTSDGRPLDREPVGLGAAIAVLPKELRQILAAGLYERALERLRKAEDAEVWATLIPVGEFRDLAFEAAMEAARLWRECR